MQPQTSVLSFQTISFQTSFYTPLPNDEQPVTNETEEDAVMYHLLRMAERRRNHSQGQPLRRPAPSARSSLLCLPGRTRAPAQHSYKTKASRKKRWGMEKTRKLNFTPKHKAQNKTHIKWWEVTQNLAHGHKAVS